MLRPGSYVLPNDYALLLRAHYSQAAGNLDSRLIVPASPISASAVPDSIKRRLGSNSSGSEIVIEALDVNLTDPLCYIEKQGIIRYEEYAAATR